ncbi:hypothetical protein T05_4056 [Trichinella murrelli]|uniref:Uncharacterized protein n=1 Tax=Trichinella murrelli TaxID=144512 RepID=A0A0V0UA85_9BILA|nr:hypothetical protein T05_4056 [Trichinella murrelli]
MMSKLWLTDMCCKRQFLPLESEQEPNFHCYALNDLYTERSEIRWGILTTVRRFKLIIGEKNMEAGC